MVSNEDRKKAVEKTISDGQTQDAKRKETEQNISNSQSGANRGYDYSSTDAEGNVTGADKGRAYTVTGNKKIYDDEKDKLEQQRIAQQKQVQQIQEIKAKSEIANQQKNAQTRPELVGAKTSMYANRGYDYKDTTNPDVEHGASPKNITPENKTGMYAVDKKTGEQYDSDESAKSFGQYTSKDNLDSMLKPSSALQKPDSINDVSQNKNYSGLTENVGFSGAGSTALIKKSETTKEFDGQSTGKIPVEDRSSDVLVKMYGFDKTKEIIDNKNRIIESNNKIIQQENKKSIDKFLGEGKALGFKQVQIKTPTSTSIVDINQSDSLISAGENAEFSFVKTPEMRKQGQDYRKEQKKFILESKKLGSQFLIKAEIKDGKTSSKIIPIDQGYKEMIRNPNATFSNVPVVPEGYAVAGNIGSNVLISTEKLKEIQPNYSPDPFSKAIQTFGEYNPYTPDKKIQGAKKPSDFEKLKYGLSGVYADVGSVITGGANLLKSGIQKISPSYMTGIGVAYQKPNVVQDFAFVPFKVGAEMINEPSINATQSQISTISEVPETPDIKISNYYKDQQTNYETFKNKAIKSGTDVYNQGSKLPFERRLGDVIGFGVTLISPTKIKNTIPFSITRTPIVVGETAPNLITTFRVGYGEGGVLFGKYSQSGKYFIGKQKPEFSQIEKMTGTESKSSFDVNEIGAYSKKQIADLRPSVKYGEQTGVFKPNEFDDVLRDANTIKKIGANKEMFKKLEIKNVNPKEVEEDFTSKNVMTGVAENRLKGIETNILIADLQKSKELSGRGGSTIFNQFKTQIKRKIGDWDFDLLKNKEKVYSKIMNSKITQEGFALYRKGSKIVTGEIDPNVKGWQLEGSINPKKGIFGRATSKEYANEFELNPDSFFKGKDDLYAGTHDKQLNVFGRKVKAKGKEEARLLIQYDMNTILRYEKLSRKERHDVFSSNWDNFNANMKQIAIDKGYYGYIKPYASPNKKFPVKEIIVYDRRAIVNAENVPPSRYGIKEGTEKDFLNILSDVDEKRELSGLKGEFFGSKSQGGIMKQKLIVAGQKPRTVTSKDIVQQLENLEMSNSQIIGKQSLQNYKGDPSKFEPIFQDYDVRMGFPTLGRAEKDIVSKSFFGLRLSAEASWKSGNKELVKEIGATMRNQYLKHKEWGFDWKNEIALLKKSGYADSKNFKYDYSKYDSLKDFSNKYGSTIGNTVYSTGSVYGKTSQNNSVFSSKSKKSSIGSVGSTKSIKTMLSPKSIISIGSSKSISSLYSVKSPSTKSISSTKSVSSTKSILSTKSPSTKSPSINSPSIKSPSIKSPSIKSPSTKSSSIKSPSILSPSLKSPSIKSPSILSPSLKSPSIKSILIKPPTIMPPRTVPIIIPKFNFGKQQKSYKDKRNPSITFRWGVKNPIFKQFSIKEGKGNRTIEW